MAETAEIESKHQEASATDVSFSYLMKKEAHNKALLHAAKFPWADVFGFLLGMVGKSGDVNIIDSIPLFHTAMFTPMLEISTKLVEKYCESGSLPKGTEIVGIYFASGRNNYSGTYPKLKKIANNYRAPSEGNRKKKEHFCLAVVDTASLADETKAGFTIFSGPGGSWKSSEQFSLSDLEGSNSSFTVLLERNAQESLCDFESWLEKPNLDWRNLNLISS